MIKRLLIDISSVAAACLYVSAKEGENSFEVEFDGKIETIPSHLDGYEALLTAFLSTLRTLGMVPSQCVMVKDGKDSRRLRRQYLAGYKDRPEKPKDFLEELNKTITLFEETLLSYGGISVCKDGYEADDMIAALAAVTEHVIWSKDGDLMAAGDWFWAGELNPEGRYPVVRKEHITIYKSLVGDQSDKIPGAKGFGEKAFIDMVAKYGDDVLDDLRDLIEAKELPALEQLVPEFKPFAKITDTPSQVYASYACAKFHHPGWTGIEWKAQFPNPNGDLGRWAKVERLVTRSVLNSPGFMDDLIADLHNGPVQVRGFDIETWQDAESLAWGEANKPKSGKPRLDTVGCHMAGFSLTCGENNEKVYYFPVDHADTDNLSLDDMTMVLNMLPEDGILSVHNSAYELPIVRLNCELHFDRGWLPNVWCTQIMKNYVDENTDLGLKYCTKKYLGYDQVTYDEVVRVPTGEVTKKGEPIYRSRQMNELTGEEVLSYGADDSVATAALYSLFLLMMQYEMTIDAYRQCEISPSYLFAESHINGIRFDDQRRQQLYEESLKRYDSIMAEINEFLKNLTWKEGDFDDGVVFTRRWPGCELIPAENLSKGEIARAFHLATGKILNEEIEGSPRTAKKVGEALAAAGYESIGLPLISEDLIEFNKQCEELFEPRPEINIKSPDQIGMLMYQALKLPIRRYNPVTEKMRAEGKKKGNPSTDDDAVKLAIAYDTEGRPEVEKLLRNILDAKEERTAESFYYLPYARMPNPKTGLVHYGAGQSKTTTRRAAPNGPNVGQVSKKSPIREIYAPTEPEEVWCSLDEVAQELRLTAHRSQCQAMLACYPHGSPARDLHSVTGVEVLRLFEKIEVAYEEFIAKKNEELFKKARNSAKAVNFGDIYGQTKFGLAIKLIITEEAAERIILAKAEAFPGVERWKGERREFFKKHGYALTLLGARKHLQLDGSWRDDSELRSALNFEIQSPAAEQIKLIMAKLWDRKFFDRYRAEFKFPVHDEINFTCHVEDVIEALREAHAIMVEQYADMSVPIESSIEVGPNFGRLTSIGEAFDAERLTQAINEFRRAV